jgi:hypothetical protein
MPCSLHFDFGVLAAHGGRPQAVRIDFESAALVATPVISHVIVSISSTIRCFDHNHDKCGFSPKLNYILVENRPKKNECIDYHFTFFVYKPSSWLRFGLCMVQSTMTLCLQLFILAARVCLSEPNWNN